MKHLSYSVLISSLISPFQDRMPGKAGSKQHITLLTPTTPL
jgi:hypothetical protein